MHKAGPLVLVLAIAFSTAPASAATIPYDAADTPSVLTHCDDPQGYVDEISCIVHDIITDVTVALESPGETLGHGGDPGSWTDGWLRSTR